MCVASLLQTNKRSSVLYRVMQNTQCLLVIFCFVDSDNISTLPLPRTTPNSRVDLQDCSSRGSSSTVAQSAGQIRNAMSAPRQRAMLTSPGYLPANSNDASINSAIRREQDFESL